MSKYRLCIALYSTLSVCECRVTHAPFLFARAHTHTHTRTHAHTHIHTHAHTRAHTHTHTRTHTHTHAHAHTHIHTHKHTHARTHTRTHAHTHARTHIHTRTRTHTHAHTHTNTHTHVHTNMQGERVISIHRESYVLRSLDSLLADVARLEGSSTGSSSASETEQVRLSLLAARGQGPCVLLVICSGKSCRSM